MEVYNNKLIQKMQRNMGISCWEEFEGDDFYNELRRQVLILTTEDEEDDRYSNEIKNSNKVEMKSYSVLQPAGVHFSWSGDKEDNNKVPKWLSDLWRKGNRDEVFNGTGVFIPHIVKSRRRNKPRRKNTEGGKAYRPVAAGNC
ncbi:uncharacterized protein [Nicotiana sylvestris]|uniref:Uncharacterized protein LOC104245433 n=1 Tax=Nicotiana sylvestris TaxID=4096 RepID=A0A1U7YBL4_NICSY|nr:PREDICTED: uncharacterized protein LOC104245433 [Nicotiana sylvestris]